MRDATAILPNSKIGAAYCIFAFFLCIALGMPSLVSASATFTVSGVSVDVSADNAVQARDNAYVQARAKAFRLLGRRLLSPDQFEEFTVPDDQVISSMIKDFEVLEERLSSQRYVGKFLFRFEEEQARDYFSALGFSFSDISAQALLILPYLSIEDNQGRLVRDVGLLSAQNVWLQAWQAQQGNLSGLVPLLIPAGDAEDSDDFPKSNPFSYSAGGFNNASNRYGVKDILVAVLRFQRPQDPSSWTSDGVPVGPASAELYRQAETGLLLVKRFPLGRVPLTAEDLQNGVSKINTFLQKDWKAQTVLDAGAQNAAIEVSLFMSDISVLVEARKRLDRVEALTGYQMVSLSPGQAVMQLDFRGRFDRLALSMEQHGLRLERPEVAAGDQAGVMRELGLARRPVLTLQ